MNETTKFCSPDCSLILHVSLKWNYKLDLAFKSYKYLFLNYL